MYNPFNYFLNNGDYIVYNKAQYKILFIFNNVINFAEYDFREFKITFVNNTYYQFYYPYQPCTMENLIFNGEHLDFNDLKNKYLNEKEKKCIKENINIFEVSNETLLDTIEIDGKSYFYENKEKGIIYDRKTNKPVGIIKNKEPIFD